MPQMLQHRDEPTVASSSQIAATFGGRYEVLERIGAGGFANVFRGRQIATGQIVAIKELRIERAGGTPDADEQVTRFRRETQICAELQHPNIVPLLDSAETEDGRLCAVFAYVSGWDLDDLLAAEGALEPAEAVHLMTQVIDAISSAHARGIIHRDLKPANIMISATGARRNAFVLDFGLGTIADDQKSRDYRRLTLDGAYLGTPFYSAPEQILGEPPTPRTDLYAWGLVLLECLTGESALGARTPHEAIHRHLSPEPVPIPAALISHELGRLLRRVTEKKVDARRISAAEALEAIQHCSREDLPQRAELLAAPPDAGGSATSSSAWRFAGWELSPIFQVPMARNPNFRGREGLLDSMGELLDANRLLAVVALTGMGGVGKSETALEYVYRNAERYQMVAWIRAERPESLAADYCAVGSSLGLPETPEQQHRIEAVRSWLERNDRWLLIFDDATDPAVLRAFLPRSHSGHVIVTSRNTSWRELAASIEVKVLEPDNAVEFLFARTGERDEQTARELCEELGGLPLALEDAAAYIERTGRSIASYLSQLRDHPQRLLLGESAPGGSWGTLRNAWELSFRQVASEAPRASELLMISAFLAPDDIPFDLFCAGAAQLPDELAAGVCDALEFDESIAALRGYSLVRVEDDHITIHRLVQLAVRERLSDDERAQWAGTSLRMMEAAYPSGALAGAYQPASGRLLPHAISVLSHAEQRADLSAVSARLLRRTGVYRSARGEHALASRDLEMALALLEEPDTPDEEQLALVLWELAMVLYVFGEAEDAQAHLDRCLSIIERNEGSASLRLAAPLITRSWVQRSLGDFEESLATAQRALAITEAKLGGEIPFNSMSLVVIARGHWNAGSAGKARAAAHRSIDLLSGDDLHPMMSGTLFHLGRVLLELGEPWRAVECAERGLDISQRAYGPNHPFVSANSAVLGLARLQLGDSERARECLERAWTSGQRICRHPHEDFVMARSDLGRLLLETGELVAARAVLEEALVASSEVCGDPTCSKISAHLALAEFHLEVGEFAEARRHCSDALALTAKRYGSDHPARIRGLEILARIRRTEEPDLALRHLKDALHIAQASQLGDHPDRATVLEAL